VIERFIRRYAEGDEVMESDDLPIGTYSIPYTGGDIAKPVIYREKKKAIFLTKKQKKEAVKLGIVRKIIILLNREIPLSEVREIYKIVDRGIYDGK